MLQRRPQLRKPRERSWATLSLQTVQTELLNALKKAITEGLGLTDTPSLFTQNASPRKARIVVGFSGGRDSVALLNALCLLKKKRNTPIDEILALHVHHALSPNANKWAKFCREMAQDLNVPFKVTYVTVKTTGEGIEAAARKARYEALVKAAKAFNASMIMTAHHEEDRLETFLIQWMRGAGVEGLATFPLVRETDGVALVRPWLHIARPLLERFLELKNLSWVDDESNADTTYLRNAIRHEVLPVMDKIRPGFRQAAARSVELVAQTSELLKEVASEDLEKVRLDSNTLSIPALMALSPMRQSLVLRAWFESFSLVPPGKARLEEALRQARETHSDTKLAFRIDNMEMRRHGARLVMREAVAPKRDNTLIHTLAWKGEGRYSVPSWSGEFVFTAVQGNEWGGPDSVLAAFVLQVRPRRGGEKFKSARNRPRKMLTALYQEADIAEYDRAALPLLWAGSDLIFAAGIGSDVRYLSEDPQQTRYRISWRPDATLLTLMQEKN